MFRNSLGGKESRTAAALRTLNCNVNMYTLPEKMVGFWFFSNVRDRATQIHRERVFNRTLRPLCID